MNHFSVPVLAIVPSVVHLLQGEKNIYACNSRDAEKYTR